MSSENVQRMRHALELFDRRDKDGWVALRDPDSEVLADRNFPERGPIRGGEAAWDFYLQVAAAFDSVESAGLDIVDVGRDKILVHQRTSTRGRASGAAVEIDYWIVVS